MALSKTTKLQAVNDMLSAGGETAIADLTTNIGANAALAIGIIDRTINDVQSPGWWFNTRIKTYTPVAGQIAIASDVVRIDGDDYWYGTLQASIRNGYAFNLLTGVDNDWTNPVTFRIVEILDWDYLPEVARYYITKKAARLFVDRHISDPNLVRLARQDESEARMALEREELQVSNCRIFGFERNHIVDAPRALDWVTEC